MFAENDLLYYGHSEMIFQNVVIKLEYVSDRKAHRYIYL